MEPLELKTLFVYDSMKLLFSFKPVSSFFILAEMLKAVIYLIYLLSRDKCK